MKKYLIILLSLVLFSCNKEEEYNAHQNENALSNTDISSLIRAALPDPLEMLDLISQPTNGYVYITTFATLNMQDMRGDEVLVGGTFHDNGIAQDFGALSIDSSILMRPMPRQNYKYESVGHPSAVNLYGNRVPIRLWGSRGLPGFFSYFDVPQLMTISAPDYANSMTIYPGMHINWNPDPNNTYGVALIARYEMSDPLNKEYRAPSVANPIHTEDDGSYTFTAKDLEGIPSGSHVKFYIGRANYSRVPMDQDGYYAGLAAYSILSADFNME